MANPFTFSNRAYTPAEAQALLARLVANPIPATNASVKGATGFRNVVSGVQRVPGKPGYHIEDPRIEDQSAKPEKPEVRYAEASTYGKVIPISLGKRRLEGNLIQSSSITPRLVGERTIVIEYDVPIYEDPPVGEEGFTTVNINPIPQDECEEPDYLDNNPPSCASSNTENGTETACGQPDGCNTRAPLFHEVGDEDGEGDGEGGGGGPEDPEDPPDIRWFGFTFDKEATTCVAVVANLNAGSIPSYEFPSPSDASNFVSNEIEGGGPWNDPDRVGGIVYQYDFTTGQVVSYTCVNS